MCECYVDQFQSEGNEYVKKLTHFHCKCKDEHLLYILFCENYPYGHTQVLEDKKCTCAIISGTDVCNFCIHVKDELIIINEYLEIIKSCRPFYYFNRRRNMVLIALDHPIETKINVKTDYRYMS